MKTELVVANIDKSVLKRLIVANHYTRRCSSITAGYGVWYRGKLSGGIVFSAGVGRFANAYCRIVQPTEVIELTRLWLHDDVPGNSESRVIAIALRTLRKGSGRFKVVLSYADEAADHVGTIYQATNFRYMGPSSPSSAAQMRIGDTIYNSRSLNSRFGTHSVERLRRILGRDDIDYVHDGTRKHAYCYPLTEEVAAWLDEHRRPYPKKSGAGSVDGDATADQAGEGGSNPTPALHSQEALHA